MPQTDKGEAERSDSPFDKIIKAIEKTQSGHGNYVTFQQIHGADPSIKDVPSAIYKELQRRGKITMAPYGGPEKQGRENGNLRDPQGNSWSGIALSRKDDLSTIVDAVSKLDARIDAFDKKTQKWRVAVRGEGERKYQKEREEYHSQASHERRRVVTDPNVHDKVFENGRMIYGAGRAWDDVADALDELGNAIGAIDTEKNDPSSSEAKKEAARLARKEREQKTREEKMAEQRRVMEMRGAAVRGRTAG